MVTFSNTDKNNLLNNTQTQSVVTPTDQQTQPQPAFMPQHFAPNIGPFPMPFPGPVPGPYYSPTMEEIIRFEVQKQLYQKDQRNNVSNIQESETNISKQTNISQNPQKSEDIKDIEASFVKKMIYGFSIKETLHIRIFINLLLFLTQFLGQNVQRNWNNKKQYTPGELLLQSFTNPNLFEHIEIINYLKNALKRFIKDNDKYLSEFFGALFYYNSINNTNIKNLKNDLSLREIPKLENFLRSLDTKRFVFDKTKLKLKDGKSLSDKEIAKQFGYILTGVLQEFLGFTKQIKYEIIYSLANDISKVTSYNPTNIEESVLKTNSPLFIAYLESLDMLPKKIRKESKNLAVDNQKTEKQSEPVTVKPDNTLTGSCPDV